MNRLLAMGALCLLVMGNGEAAPISSKDKPTQATPVQATTNYYEPIALPSPVLVKVVPADNSQGISDEKKREEKKSSYDRIVAYSTLALAGITAVLAFYTACLWGATRKLVDEAKSASKDQSDDMKESLRIATESANSTAALVTTMEANAQRELRAYIGIERILAVKGGVGITYCNRGITPAHNVGFKVWHSVGKQLTTEEIIGRANREIGVESGISEVIAWKEMDQNIIMNLSEQDWELLYGLETYICGMITYSDVFGQKRETCFQFLMTAKMGNWNFSGCTKGNRAT